MQGISRRTTKLHPATSPQLTKAGTSWTSNGVRHNPPSTYSSWYWGNWEPRLTAWLAFEYEWQYIHYFMMGLLLLCILITFITMPYHKYTTRRFPINFKQFGNASIFCITLTCITYVLTYGKVLDWYDDPTYDGPQSAPSLLAAYSSISSLPSAILTINSMYSNCAPSVWVSYSIFC